MNFTMESNVKKSLIYIIFALFMQSCGLETQNNYAPDWEPAITSHTLLFSEPTFTRLLWERQAYVLSSAYKNIQCVSTKDVIVLVGSQNSNDMPKVFALDGKSGSLLWSFENAGVLAYSEEDLFIGSETNVYLIDPKTGAVKWRKQLPGIRNITNMMYYDNLLFINGSGTNFFYVLDNDGEIISKYTQVSGFRSDYSNVPFYPTLPFGNVIDDDVFILQSGDGLYYGDVYDKNANTIIWKVDGDSISNFIVLDNYILWVSSNDEIKIADKLSGNLIESIKIVPSVDFFDPRINKQYAGYYLCGDSQSKNVFVILGDSRQIFALKFTK